MRLFKNFRLPGVLLLALTAPAAHAATFLVDSTADTADATPGDGICGPSAGSCTLRAAIQEANAHVGADIINFGISGTGVHTITPASPLPALTQPVTIDGYTQPGSSANTLAIGDNAKLLIELNGANAGDLANGLVIVSASCTVRGLIINRFLNGVVLNGAAGTTIAGCFIGTNAAGTSALPNRSDGVFLDGATGAIIGGTSSGARNLISGNSGVGVTLTDLSNSDTIQGNLIGTNAAGTSGLGNNVGISVFSGTGARLQNNVLAGNGIGSGGAGIGVTALSSGSISDVEITGNLIGTNAQGTAKIGNELGILLVSTGSGAVSNVRIGLANKGNTIAGSLGGQNNAYGDGIRVYADTTATLSGLSIGGNFIGTNASGATDLGNRFNGINLNGVSNAQIGGTATGKGNVIAYNGANGVVLSANVVGSNPVAVGNRIARNSIFANALLGINLNNGITDVNGVTANDAHDPDSGPNTLQNYPVITGGGATITGTFNSIGGKTYHLEFFSSDSVDLSGFGEGQTYIGATDVTTNADGDINTSTKTFTFTPASPVAAGQFVTATATDPNGNTSEFSQAFQVAADSCSTVVTNANDRGDGSFRAAIDCSNTTPGKQTISFNIPGTGVHTITPATPLPAFTDPVTIDAYTQPGSKANTLAVGDNAVLLIELNGTNAGANANGLLFNVGTDNSLVRGLVINRFKNVGVLMLTQRDLQVAGCFIGTNPAGTVALGNKIGVSMISPAIINGVGFEDTAGGTTPAERNVISGNQGEGVSGGGQVFGNYIGTNAQGNGALPNAMGLKMTAGGAISSNVISGNTGTGFFASNFQTGDMLLNFNLIGTNAQGDAAVPNGVGVSLGQGTANLITDNVISGNTGAGVDLASQSNGFFLRNFIGTNKAGTGALPNGDDGIHAVDVTAGAMTIGLEGAGNTIAFNKGNGISISGSGSTGTKIQSNSIFSNGKLGIDLVGANDPANGVTPNDNLDPDSGPSNLQNYPVLTAAGATIKGTLNSTASTLFHLEFFSSNAADPSGFGEGQTFLGTMNVTTNAQGNVSFTFTPTAAVPAGQFVTATATDPNSNTSEFSKAVQVPGGTTKTGTSTTLGSSLNPSTVGQSVTFTATVTPASGTTIPTGTVTFKEGTTTLGTGTLSSDKATFATSSLSMGSHVITAVYGGSTTFSGSTSAAVTQVVNAAPIDADLSVTKTAVPDPVTLGANVTYTVVVTNNGPNTANAVKLIDILPASTTLVSQSGTFSAGGATPAPVASGHMLIYMLGTLTSGAKATLSIIVKTTTAGTITNAVKVSSTTSDSNRANNTAKISTTVNPPATVADLALTKAAPASVTAGGALTYTMVISNSGPNAAAGVTLSDTLPAGLTFVRDTVTDTSGTHAGNPTHNGQGLSYSLGTLAAGGRIIVRIVARVASSTTGTLHNTASVSSGTGDPNAINNGASANTTVNVPPTRADLSVASAVTSPITVGQNFTLNVTVTNNGPNTATGVQVSDTLPAGVTLPNGLPAGATINGRVVTFNAASLASGGKAVFSLVLNTSSAGPFVNSANVSNNVPDPNPDNNSTSLSVPINPAPACATDVTAQLSITRGILRSQGSYLFGLFHRTSSRFDQTITIRNIGNTPIAGPLSLVLDGLPANVTLLNENGTTACASPLGNPYLNANVGTDGVLSPGEQVTISLSFNAPAGNVSFSTRALAGSGPR